MCGDGKRKNCGLQANLWAQPSAWCLENWYCCFNHPLFYNSKWPINNQRVLSFSLHRIVGNFANLWMTSHLLSKKVCNRMLGNIHWQEFLELCTVPENWDVNPDFVNHLHCTNSSQIYLFMGLSVLAHLSWHSLELRYLWTCLFFTFFHHLIVWFLLSFSPAFSFSIPLLAPFIFSV